MTKSSNILVKLKLEGLYLKGEMHTRRKFLTILAGSGFLKLFPAETQPTSALDPNDPTAKALGYVEDHTKVDVSRWPKKAGDKEGKQICKTCILWTKGNLKVVGKEGEWGVCSIFPRGLVSANGWCNSWAPRPGA
ncbi:MAG: high-potential iron-sulfur protein [Deltaproteobacteria bacterium]|nr:high-potential iron-sulfur protein [Deltaproteobacteria bacterium]